jgi:pimeloyl-ACP methyl ester carboxylesterase
MTPANAERRVSVNGLDTYFEIHGDDRPLVLLHGAISTIGSSFGKLLPSMALTHRVVAIEQQAHGHTPDINRPLTYGQMADDTVALLRELGVESADFFGYSMGAGIALEKRFTGRVWSPSSWSPRWPTTGTESTPRSWR